MYAANYYECSMMKMYHKCNSVISQTSPPRMVNCFVSFEMKMEVTTGTGTTDKGQVDGLKMDLEPCKNDPSNAYMPNMISTSYLTAPLASHAIRKLSRAQSRHINCSIYTTKAAVTETY